MPDKTPSSLIINSPYEKPARYWDQDENGKLLTVTQGRRPAAYELYDTRIMPIRPKAKFAELAQGVTNE